VTFGSFNNFSKVGAATLAAWGRLLRAVPHSRLRLKTSGLGEPAVAAFVRERLAVLGVDPGRLELLDRTPDVAAHLSLYHGVDLALDTFPYHGTTTTCEALWMGVPVITLAGDRHAARVGASLLSALGRPEWIAGDWPDYVSLAAALAKNLPALTAARAGLRGEMQRSPLCDHRGQAARFGAALRQCWLARAPRQFAMALA
jgi:predicted O-linked N-acetylglucosamine transferase (SPINDLY family)